MRGQGIQGLPKRGDGGSQFRQVELITNYKAVTVKYKILYLYSVQFKQQNMTPDNRLQYNRLLTNSEKEIGRTIGVNYAINGRTLYGFDKPTIKEKQVSLELDGVEFNAMIKFVKEIPLSVALDGENKQSIMFLNSKLKNGLRKLGFNQIGRSRKYFNTKKSQDMGDLLLYRGYQTCFIPKLTGLLLKIDTANRIVRKETVLNFITSLYQSNRSLGKDEKRSVVRESLINHSIMANYGTSISWKIQDIVFDKNMSDLKLDGEELEFNLIEYYQEKYNIHIENTKQPLIKSSDKVKKTVYLVPELCLMTGIPETCDERRRMQISKMTIKDADYKFRKIQELNQQIQENNNFEMNTMGINLNRDFLKITAEEVECSELMMGQNPVGSNRFDSVDKGREACFQLFNKALFKSKVELNMLIIHFGFNTQEIKKIFTSTSQKILLPIKISEKDLGRIDNNWFENLANCVENKKDSFNLIFFILPAKVKTKYPDIKKLCYSDQDNCINSQVALETKFNPKSVQSVSTKILLQMAVKIGNILWVPKPPKTDIKIMIVGIACVKIPNSKQSIVAYSSTKDKLFSRYHSSYRYQSKESSLSIIEKTGEIVIDCIKAYVDYNNNQYPDAVIVLREGSTDAQVSIIMENEIKNVLSSLELSSKNVKLVYISIDKKPTTKLFKKMDGRMVNPNAGTLVRNQIISSPGDFYLISNQNKMSAVVPVYYKILFNNTQDNQLIDSTLLARLFYTQSHNYMNWTGSVRIPSQLQYACKLAKFKSESFKGKQIHHKLQSFIYYI